MSNRSVQQYINALATTPQLPFKHLKDRNFQLVYNENKKPVRISGSSSVVFKITDGEKFYALKCYVTELFNRWEYLDRVRQEIKSIEADWIVPFEILKNEIEVITDEGKSEPCNIILMPWIEGNRLTDLVKQYTSNYRLHNQLKELTLTIRDLANKQVGQPFSHGDISPENIIVTPTGEMVLVDHDSYNFEGCQTMAGGGGWSLAYQHPNRHPLHTNLEADHFSFLTLTISLKAIELNPDLFQQFNSSKGLLFTIDDYKNLEYSKIFGEIKKIDDPYLQHLLDILVERLKTKEISIPELLQHLNGSVSSSAPIVLQPASTIANSEMQEETVHADLQPVSSSVINDKGLIEEQTIPEEIIQHQPAETIEEVLPLLQPGSSLVINDEGLIEEQTIPEEIIQHQPAETTEEVLPLLQPIEQLTITDPAHKQKRKKSRIAIAAILSTVLLVLLGIKAFFPETKFVNPVDYKNLGSREQSGNTGITLEKENNVTDEVVVNNNQKTESNPTEDHSTNFFPDRTKEINNAVTVEPAPSNSDAENIQVALQKVPDNSSLTKTKAVKQKNYTTKRKSNDHSVTFRKTGF